MSKQTALKWFIEQLGLDCTTDYKEEIEQALQMEREQIDNFIDFINERHFNQFIISKDEAEIYYNETYGGK